MAVTENGAHLTGAEVEYPPPGGIPHEAALSAFRDKWCELAAVANQMGSRLLPEHRVGIAALGLSHVVHMHSWAGPCHCHSGPPHRHPALSARRLCHATATFPPRQPCGRLSRTCHWA